MFHYLINQASPIDCLVDKVMKHKVLYAFYLYALPHWVVRKDNEVLIMNVSNRIVGEMRDNPAQLANSPDR
jgi:hypothetical protein